MNSFIQISQDYIKEVNLDFLNKFNVIDTITVITFLVTVFFFFLDKFLLYKNDLEIYINRLISLKYEILKNKNTILFWIKQLEDQLKLGNKVIDFRFDSSVKEKMIVSGELLDLNIVRNLDALLIREKQINLILDGISKKAEMSHIDSREMAELFKRRIIASSKLVISMSSDLDKYYEKIISDLDTYITEQKSNKFLKIKKLNPKTKNQEIPNSFWVDVYRID